MISEAIPIHLYAVAWRDRMQPERGWFILWDRVHGNAPFATEKEAAAAAAEIQVRQETRILKWQLVTKAYET